MVCCEHNKQTENILVSYLQRSLNILMIVIKLNLTRNKYGQNKYRNQNSEESKISSEEYFCITFLN